MPHKSPLKKFEERFGAVTSRKEAQELANTAKGLLVEKKEEFLKELSKRVFINSKDGTFRISILGLNKKEIALIETETYHEESGKTLFIRRISVGELTPEDPYAHQLNNDFKFKDPLRKLGIFRLLMRILLVQAKKRNIRRLELKCGTDALVSTYRRYGFRVKKYFLNGGAEMYMRLY